MKRTWRILAVLAILGGVGAAATWRTTSPARPAAPHSLSQAGDPERDESLYRYRHNLPRHWRDVMFGW